MKPEEIARIAHEVLAAEERAKGEHRLKSWGAMFDADGKVKAKNADHVDSVLAVVKIAAENGPQVDPSNPITAIVEGLFRAGLGAKAAPRGRGAGAASRNRLG